jgi:RNA polymerase sigma factor (sigma-70 family)
MTGFSNTPLPPLSELISSIRAGDELATAAFVNHFEPHLHRVLRVTKVIRFLQSQIDSQDLVQSVFARVIAEIRGERVQFSDMAGLEAYLKTVGRNRLRDEIRRLKAAKRDRARVKPGAAAVQNLAQPGPTPTRVVEIREQLARVEACASPSELKLLNERADGISWQELAAARGINPDALRKRIERIRRRIREALGEDPT